MSNTKAIAVYQSNAIAEKVLIRSIDKASERAPYTLPGLLIGGIIGALIDGPRGAFIGGTIGGSLGFIADMAKEGHPTCNRSVLPATTIH